MRVSRRGGWRAMAGLVATTLASPCLALEPVKGEEAALKTCEESVCRIILGKERKGSDPDCKITKTWAKDTIKKGESSMVSWAFGDTRCHADLKVPRRDIVMALTEPKYTLQATPQKVKCVVEQDGKLNDLTATASPKLKFKNGKADKIWINLETIEGPDNVASTIRTIAAMEDKLGIFHGPLIKSVNKFIQKRCAKKYGPGARTAKADIDDDEDGDKKPDKAKVSAGKDAKATGGTASVKPKSADTDKAQRQSEPAKAKAAP